MGSAIFLDRTSGGPTGDKQFTDFHIQAPHPGAGGHYAITRSRDSTINLRTQFEWIIHRAGLLPWPKLFHNLRATRETELAEAFPLHVVCAWIGNSSTIAAKHYLQVTDEHFDRAVAALASQQDADEVEKKAAQNAAQQAHAGDRNGSQEKTEKAKTPRIAGFCGLLRQSANTQTNT